MSEPRVGLPNVLLVVATVVAVQPNGLINISLNKFMGETLINTHKCSVLSHLRMPKKNDKGTVLISNIEPNGAINNDSMFTWIGTPKHFERNNFSDNEEEYGLLSENKNWKIKSENGGIVLGDKDNVYKITPGVSHLQVGYNSIHLDSHHYKTQVFNKGGEVAYKVYGDSEGRSKIYTSSLNVNYVNNLNFVSRTNEGAVTFTGNMDDNDFTNAKPINYFGVKARNIKLSACGGTTTLSGTALNFIAAGCKLSKSKVGLNFETVDGDIVMQTGLMGNIKHIVNNPQGNLTFAIKPVGKGVPPVTPQIKITLPKIEMKAMNLNFEGMVSVKSKSIMYEVDAKLLKLKGLLNTIEGTMTMIKGMVKLDGAPGGPTGFCCIPVCPLIGVPHTTPTHIG